MNRIYSDDIYEDDKDIDKSILIMEEREQEVLDSMDAVFNETRWEGDIMVVDKEIMATSLDDDFIAKVRIESPTPEVVFAIEHLLEKMWDEE